MCGVRHAAASGAQPSWIDVPATSRGTCTRPEPHVIAEGKDETSCRLTHGVDIHHGIDPHEFKSAAMAAKHANELSDAARTTAMAAIRDAIEPTEEKPVKTLDDLRDTKPELAERLARIAAVVPAVAMREVEA